MSVPAVRVNLILYIFKIFFEIKNVKKKNTPKYMQNKIICILYVGCRYLLLRFIKRVNNLVCAKFVYDKKKNMKIINIIFLILLIILL